ncbi:hypothetical protein EOM09_08485, partial [bacterium]|nr:hypothetical protein [bacterium]
MLNKEAIYPRQFARDTLSLPTDPPQIKEINATICNLAYLLTVNEEDISSKPEKVSTMSLHLTEFLVKKSQILNNSNKLEEAKRTGILARKFYQENIIFFIESDKQSAKNILTTNGIL